MQRVANRTRHDTVESMKRPKKVRPRRKDGKKREVFTK